MFARGSGFSRRRSTSGLLRLATGLLMVFAGGSGEARAQADALWREAGTGGSATGHTWIIYSSATVAPFSHLYDDGLRVRVATGHGGYEVTHRGGCRRVNRDVPCATRAIEVDGRATFSDVLVGYLKRSGALTAKAFIGVSYIDHQIPDFDGDLPTGEAWGPKLVGELWYDPGGVYWASFNAGFTTAHNTFALGSRLGLRIDDKFSIGPELYFDRNGWHELDLEGFDRSMTRGGLFVRYAWDTGEISASAGVARDLSEPLSPYATLNWLTKF